MSHWLEEAEKGTATGKRSGHSAGFLDRKHHIEKNYKENKEAYKAFITELKKLRNRINALPLEKKVPFGNIDIKYKESKLGNQRYILRSSKRFEKKLFRGSIFDIFKPRHFKHMRMLTITLSSQMGKIGLDIKEETMLKERIVVDKDLVKEKKKYTDKNRYHNYFNWEVDKLDNKFAMVIMDWLAYKIELNELPFVK